MLHIFEPRFSEVPVKPYKGELPLGTKLILTQTS